MLPLSPLPVESDGATGAQDTGVSVADEPKPSLQAFDLLTDLLRFDRAALEHALQQFLREPDRLGNELVDLLAGRLFPWLIGAVLAATAYEVTRKLQRARTGACLVTGCEALPGTFPELADLSFREEP
ncbi:MAG: hypothetical protein L0Z62_30160 [Gemmataceae bacterium]|nr:hypothetical protein [Gemmataceae bacterium]